MWGKRATHWRTGNKNVTQIEYGESTASDEWKNSIDCVGLINPSAAGRFGSVIRASS